jgi:uncharacterized protein (TIGR02145 family)
MTKHTQIKIALLFAVAVFSGCSSDDGESKIKDADGNVYTSVKIGTQTWMVENLKTSKYNDGTSIPTGLTNTEWTTTTTPAYCIYENNDLYNNTYGKLYNWHAVNTGKLAPKGWHVPTNAELSTLRDYLGGFSAAGGKMKSTSTLWATPNSLADNSSGFTSLPEGERDNSDGVFYNVGNYARYWSSTAYASNSAYGYSLAYYNGDLYSRDYSNNLGFAVRCIKN